MVGNAAPPPSDEPHEPATWKDELKAILVFVGIVFACGAGVVAYAAHLIGYF